MCAFNLNAQEVSLNIDTSLVEPSYKENIRKRIEECLGKLDRYKLIIASSEPMSLFASALMMKEKNLSVVSEARIWAPHRNDFELIELDEKQTSALLEAVNRLFNDYEKNYKSIDNEDKDGEILELFERVQNGDVLDWRSVKIKIYSISDIKNKDLMKIIELMIPAKYRTQVENPWEE